MKPRRSISAYVLLVGLLGLSIVGGILTFQIFSASTKSQLTPEQQQIIKPINGTIDQKIVQNLEARSVISNDQINSLSPSNTQTTLSAPTTIVTPSATVAAELSTTGTGSATLTQ